MAGAFEDFPLDYAGTDYTIPANRRMGAIAAVEEVITLPELMALCQRESVPLGKLSAAYGALLRYAGARVTDEEVYAGMFADGDFFSAAAMALQGLMTLMVPPSAMNGAGDGGPEDGETEKKTGAPAKKPGSSKGSTRRSSARAGSRRANSGR